MSVEPARSEKFARRLNWLPYTVILALFIAVILFGYFAFRAFATTSDLSQFNLYALAVIAGIASFFSPCAFPLLPGYLSVYTLAGEQSDGSPPTEHRGLSLGFSAALGVISFNLILGIGIAVLGTGLGKELSISGPEPSSFVRIFRGGVGVILLTLGLGQLTGWNLKPRFIDSFTYWTRPQREGSRTPATSMYLYGLGYNAAGMGCTGPILAGLMVFALSSGGFVSTLTAFAVFALTMGTLMLAIFGLVAASQQALITRLKAATTKIKSVASVLLVLVGLFNIYTSFNIDLFQRFLFP